VHPNPAGPAPDAHPAPITNNNPSRLEQRIGRIDRYGQHHVPEIYHFAPEKSASTDAADTDFLRRIAEKVGTVA
jgi:hypothetical protein